MYGQSKCVVDFFAHIAWKGVSDEVGERPYSSVARLPCRRAASQSWLYFLQGRSFAKSCVEAAQRMRRTAAVWQECWTYFWSSMTLFAWSFCTWRNLLWSLCCPAECSRQNGTTVRPGVARHSSAEVLAVVVVQHKWKASMLVLMVALPDKKLSLFKLISAADRPRIQQRLEAVSVATQRLCVNRYRRHEESSLFSRESLSLIEKVLHS